jgi:hypothetical protein
MIEYGHDKKQKLGEILDNHNHVYILEKLGESP